MMHSLRERISLALLLLLSAPAWAIPAPLNQSNGVKIKVRIAESVVRARVRGMDLRLRDGNQAQAAEGTSEWEFSCDADKVRVTRSDRKTESQLLKSPVSVDSPAGFVRFHGRPFRETLRIHAKGAFCVVVNEVDLEKYLDGLVSSEFSAKWAPEAIGAQVVAARTYALHQMKIARRKKQVFDLDSTIKDQVYDGSEREDYRASRIVEKTRGMVLTLNDPKTGKPVPLKAFYHSTCGGRTELPEKVWGGTHPGFKRRVECSFCMSSPRYNWNLEAKTQDLISALETGIAEDGVPKRWPRNYASVLRSWQLKDIRVQAFEDRVSQVVLSWSKGDQSVELPLSGPKFRMWMGAGKMLSTSYNVVSRAGGLWAFSGRGNGHGVGLCQWGAKVMGEKGYETATILRHYYPDAILRKLW